MRRRPIAKKVEVIFQTIKTLSTCFRQIVSHFEFLQHNGDKNMKY